MAIDGPLNIPGVRPALPARPAGPATPMDPAQRAAVPGASFAEILRNSIAEVNQLQVQADAAIRDLALGRSDNVTAVVSQIEKADVAFRALLAVRNQIIEAYEEISRLRV